jgi:hypothetical protein
MVPFKEELPAPLRFVRRINKNLTIDSICGYCARTVLTSKDIRALAEAEAGHECLDPAK